jgi:TRAP-type mannitol/chloroaromatic compound transport system substrate-binding protein
MKRRQFVGGLAVAAGLAGCSRQQDGSEAEASRCGETFEWSIATSWPPKYPGLGIAVNNLAERIEAASGGRLKLKVYAAGELVPAFEAFDAASRGIVEMGHDAAYYHKGKIPAAQFMTAIPFGMTFMEMNAWLYYGGGLELWRELYEPLNLVPFPCGNTGVQMGGWFNKEINSIADLKGLKMRIGNAAGVRNLYIPANRRHRCDGMGGPLQRHHQRIPHGCKVLLLPRVAGARARAAGVCKPGRMG